MCIILVLFVLSKQIHFCYLLLVVVWKVTEKFKLMLRETTMKWMCSGRKYYYYYRYQMMMLKVSFQNNKIYENSSRSLLVDAVYETCKSGGGNPVKQRQWLYSPSTFVFFLFLLLSYQQKSTKTIIHFHHYYKFLMKILKVFTRYFHLKNYAFLYQISGIYNLNIIKNDIHISKYIIP